MKKLAFLLILLSIIGVSCSSENQKLETKDPKIDAIAEMKNHLEYLASDELEGRETGTQGEIKAAEYIADEFKKLGLTPMGSEGYYQKFKFKPMVAAQAHETGDSISLGMGLVQEIEGRNVIGFLDNQKESTVVIGAHFDHLGLGGQGSLHAGEEAIHNGADDNASGISSLLYITKYLNDHYKNNNYLIMAFSGEEKGLYGSSYFCKNPTYELEKINYMLNMDMVGRLREEKVLAVYGVGSSPIWPSTLEQVQVDSIEITTDDSGIGPSDHTSFYLVDIPVLHFFTGQHEDYHKPTDDSHLINYDGIYSVSNYILEVVKMLDDDTETLEFTKSKEDEEDQEPRSFKVTMGIIPNYLHTSGGLGIDGTKDDRPGAKAGLIKGDIVTWIDEHDIVDINAYMDVLGIYEPGESCTVKFTREGKEMETTLTWD